MQLRAKSNLKTLLDERGISIQQFSRDTGLKFETLRRLYHDDTKQYQRDTIGIVCQTLGIAINELLVLVEQEELAEKSADLLDEPIELLNLDPEIFLPIRRTFREAKTVRDLLGKDFGIITDMGAKRMEVLRKAVKDFTGEDVELHNSRHKGNK